MSFLEKNIADLDFELYHCKETKGFSEENKDTSFTKDSGTFPIFSNSKTNHQDSIFNETLRFK
jgi:hypothetical protein